MISSEYKRYLRCKHWQELRQQVLNRAGGRGSCRFTTALMNVLGMNPWMI